MHELPGVDCAEGEVVKDSRRPKAVGVVEWGAIGLGRTARPDMDQDGESGSADTCNCN